MSEAGPAIGEVVYRDAEFEGIAKRIASHLQDWLWRTYGRRYTMTAQFMQSVAPDQSDRNQIAFSLPNRE